MPDLTPMARLLDEHSGIINRILRSNREATPQELARLDEIETLVSRWEEAIDGHDLVATPDGDYPRSLVLAASASGVEPWDMLGTPNA